jgi:dipicolinate synthase subunit A
LNTDRFLIIGGDLRNLYLYEILKREGRKVKACGFSEYKNGGAPAIRNIKTLSRALLNTDVVIGPTPCCGNGLNLNAPFNAERIPIEEVFDGMNKSQIFIAGRISPEALKSASARGIRTFDILSRDEMAVLNAIPTAEGAIQLAMENTTSTLHGNPVIVLGFGRIGKFLVKMLNGVGAKVTVAARKPSDISLARGYGYNATAYDGLSEYLGAATVIFNTVPSVVLDKSNIGLINRGCLIIDLASKPFGIDSEEARKEGLNVIWGPSLPGKVAPATSAEYVRETIERILNEQVE